MAETDTNPYRRLHRLLRVLFSTTLSKTEKLDILEKEFGIVQGAYDASMIESLRKETDTMCNLSQAVKELGIEIGKKRKALISDVAKASRSANPKQNGTSLFLSPREEWLSTRSRLC